MADLLRRQSPRSGARLGQSLGAVLIVVVAGCSASPSATEASSTVEATSSADASGSAMPSTGAPSALGDVPWSKVGPGWLLAQWSQVTPHRPGENPEPGQPTPQTAGATLYLVAPGGDRYAITTFAPAGDLGLVDWSSDGSHALLAKTAVTPDSAVSVDLHTGAQTTVPVAGHPRYARPDGSALLVSTSFNGKRPGLLTRVDLNGEPELKYQTDDVGGAGPFSGEYAMSPDGAQLVLGTANLGNELVPRTDNSLLVIDGDGAVIRRLPAPMPDALCGPVKWWTPQTLLVHCTSAAGAGNQLWEVPLDGAAATALTALNSGQGDDPGFGGDLGDGDAWKLPSGVFLQSAGAGCSRFVSQLTPDGHTTRVNVPDVAGGAAVVGATDDRLVLLDQPDCGATTALVSYDPAAGTSTVLLGPPVNGGSVSSAMLHPVPGP